MEDLKMTVPTTYDTTGIEHYTIPNFRFHNGAEQTIRVAYRQFNPDASRKVLVPTCYGGRINDEQYRTKGVLAHRHMIVVAMLGNGESSSPSNTKDFPPTLDYRDCVNAQYRLLTEKLGIKKLEAVIGFSMGGQQAYYWAKMYPRFIESAISVCSSARTSVHNIAFLAGPEAALLNSADYGNYIATGEPPSRGLAAMGRAWAAWFTSAAWYRKGYWKAMAPSVDVLLATMGEDSFMTWDAKDLMILMGMWRRGNIGEFSSDGNAALEQSLAEIEVPMLLMPCRTDAYFAWEDSENEIKYLKKPSRLEIIESDWGHCAGSDLSPEDTKWVDERIGLWLQERAG